MRRAAFYGMLAAGVVSTTLSLRAQSPFGPPPQGSGPPASSGVGPATGYPSTLAAPAGDPSAAAPSPATAPAPAPAPPANEYQPPKRWTIHQNEFTIPFSVDESLPEDQRPVEAQLYVSSDLGANWTRYASENPDAGKFSFKAATQGTYWFALRTMDRDERLSPARPLSAEVVVTVDTQPPTLEFTARRNEQGQLEATWKALDDRIEPRSFKIETLMPGAADWRSLPLAQPGRATPTSLIGTMAWNGPPDLSGLQLRAEVLDQAGNRTVVTETLPTGLAPVAAIPLTPVGQGPPASPAPATTTPGATQPPAAAVATARSPGALVSNATPSGSSFPGIVPSPGADGANAPGSLRTSPTSNSPYPPPPPIGGPQGTPATSAVGSSLASPPPAAIAPQYPAAPPTGSGNSYPSAPTPSISTVAPVVAAPYPPTAHTFGDPALPSDGARQSFLPPGERPMMTNRRNFNLDYDLDRVGAGDLADVELWATRDGGRSWQKWGNDADVRSPFPVNVEAEGTYGFRTVVISRTGLASPSPRPGEPADVWVGIDWTAPRVRVGAAPYAEGPQTGQLHITWEASDAALGERPIGLFFAASPEGPWQSIAQGLPNVGQYYWKVDPRAPARVYLKIDATDAAGNVGTDRLTSPIDIGGLVPTARIRGISPIPETAPSANTSWLPSWLQWR